MPEAKRIRELLREYLASLEQLRPYGIESLADYSEFAFEQILGGKRAGRGEKGHDVLVPGLGRVQVSSDAFQRMVELKSDYIFAIVQLKVVTT